MQDEDADRSGPQGDASHDFEQDAEVTNGAETYFSALTVVSDAEPQQASKPKKSGTKSQAKGRRTKPLHATRNLKVRLDDGTLAAFAKGDEIVGLKPKTKNNLKARGLIG